jgi:hypothetical protein
MCQSYLLDPTASTCALYHLRRCMAPEVHNNFITVSSGQLFEKVDVPIPADSIIIESYCGKTPIRPTIRIHIFIGDYRGTLFLNKLSTGITKIDLAQEQQNIQLIEE